MPDDDITEPQHRLHRAPESQAALVLRAVAWATLWFTLAITLSTWAIPGRPAWGVAAVLASLAVLQVVHSHRRRQR